MILCNHVSPNRDSNTPPPSWKLQTREDRGYLMNDLQTMFTTYPMHIKKIMLEYTLSLWVIILTYRAKTQAREVNKAAKT